MKRFLRYYRAMRLARLGRDAYNAAVYSCANVSRVNNSLAFVIRPGTFSYPCVEQIQRPDIVVIAEND